MLAFFLTVALAGLGLGEEAGPVGLETLSGTRLVMENYADRPATAVLFLSTRCPLTLREIERIHRLQEKYRRREVLYVGVFSQKEETGAEIRALAQGRGLIFPLYRDPGREVATRFGARATPEVFLLDEKGKLVFHGGLASEAGQGALEDAIVSLLAGKPVVNPETPVAGTPIEPAGAKLTIEDSFGSIHFSSELIFEKVAGAAVHHCSTIAVTARGDLLATWYGGTYESSDDQALYLSRRPLGTRLWSEPVALISDPLQPPGNGVIFRDSSGHMRIVWGRMEKRRPHRRGIGWDQCRLFARVSLDDGKTWSADEPIGDFIGVPRNPPIRLRDGTWLLGLEGMSTDNKNEGSYFLVGKDTSGWERAGFIDRGSQPALAERSDGSVLALLRHPLRIQVSDSADAGRSWSAMRASKFANPDAGISMTRLENGHLVLVFNDSAVDRTPLRVVRSRDEGKTWERPLDLETNPGEYSYPCVVQASDGRIHVTYTYRRYSIKHVEFDEGWLEHFERPD